MSETALDRAHRAMEAAPEDEAARLAHRDQLAAIGSRIQWIENPEQRRFLEGKLAALWEKAEPPSA